MEESLLAVFLVWVGIERFFGDWIGIMLLGSAGVGGRGELVDVQENRSTVRCLCKVGRVLMGGMNFFFFGGKRGGDGMRICYHSRGWLDDLLILRTGE